MERAPHPYGDCVDSGIKNFSKNAYQEEYPVTYDPIVSKTVTFNLR